MSTILSISLVPGLVGCNGEEAAVKSREVVGEELGGKKMAAASSLMEVTNPTRSKTVAKSSMDLLELLRKRGMDGEVDFLREALQVLVAGIMDSEVSAQIGAEHGERNPDRLTRRNGYRSRDMDTRVGTMELRIPKVREGSYFSSRMEPTAAQREGAAGGDPAGLRGGSVHQKGG